MTRIEKVGAVVLAAGQSSRMGRPKLTLPWGKSTVIEHVVTTLQESGISTIMIVTGAAREEIEAALANCKVMQIYNPQFHLNEMLVSLQSGIRALQEKKTGCDGLLVVLGDQPTIEVNVIKEVMGEYLNRGSSLVIPSYQMRRGHPWLVGWPLWNDLLKMPPEATLRDFMRCHNQMITYVAVDSPGILKDLDTPDDYQRLQQE